MREKGGGGPPLGAGLRQVCAARRRRRPGRAGGTAGAGVGGEPLLLTAERGAGGRRAQRGVQVPGLAAL